MPKISESEMREWTGKHIDDFAKKHFSYIRDKRIRSEKAAETIRGSGFSVNRDGIIFKRTDRKPDVVVALDKFKRPFLKFKGKASKRAYRNGFNVLLFPMKDEKDKFLASIQSWGGFGLKVPVDRGDIEFSANDLENVIRVKLPTIHIYPKDDDAALQIRKLVSSHKLLLSKAKGASQTHGDTKHHEEREKRYTRRKPIRR